MKIVIAGAGAMGCLFAGMLRPAGNEVCLLEKDPDRIAEITRSGIFIARDGAELHLQGMRIAADASPFGTADMVVLLVKAYDTAAALSACMPAVGTRTTVLTLQNGLGNIEAICRCVDSSLVLAGTTAHGATMTGNGRVQHAGKGETVIGPLVPAGEKRAEDVQRVFRGAGISTTVSRDIQSALWGKLVVNAGINALTAIMDVKNGALHDSPHLLAVMSRAVREAVAVADRLGIALPYSDPVARCREVCISTAENISSMCQDIRSGRRTEIDSINGAVADCGRSLGVATPVNSTLTGLVHTLEIFSGQ